MQVTFLEAKVPLTKKFTASTKEPYPNAYEFKSHVHTVRNLAHFADLIEEHAGLGHCLLKGNLNQDLNWESRAGQTNPNAPTEWACLDIDNLVSVPDIDTFMARIGLADVSYILQWSASYGVNGNFNVRAHVFILLDQAISPPALKTYLRQLNLTVFQSDLTLTKTNTSLRWGLDTTTCQNDKLLFITPPNCTPTSLDQFNGKRIVLVTKTKDTASLTAITLLSAEQLKTLEETEINRLRRNLSLPERKPSQFKLKDYKGESYLPNPDQATVTSVKEERGFVYLNLNGGDSWAYYHPSDNPTFIYNFKGEPTYKTNELLPDYWTAMQANRKATTRAKQSNKLFLAFRDLRTAEYYNGWFDTATDTLELHAAKSEKQLTDFLSNYGQPSPEAIPIWNIVYDPKLPPIDLTARRVNTFRPSSFMVYTASYPTLKASPTPTIDRILRHVVGTSMYDQFFNWTAFCYQHRSAPKTAWVLHGLQGTGKGLLYHEILAKLFGYSNVTQKRMEELEDKFNDFIEGCLVIFVDEAQISDSGRNKMIMANLKNYITEPTIAVRRMRQSSYEVPNHAGWIFASNMPDPVVVDSSDRRFNVGEYQSERLMITDAEIALIEDELAHFALRLAQHKIDYNAVRTPVINAAKQEMIMVSRSSADTVADAIVHGDLSVLWDALPTVADNMLDPATMLKLQPYKALVYDLVTTRRDKLTREELFLIFNYNVGNVPNSPWKFTTYAKHHGLAVKDIRIGSKTTKGVIVKWTNSEEWFAEKMHEIEIESAPKIKVLPTPKVAS